jgi:hypothetical protein
VKRILLICVLVLAALPVSLHAQACKPTRVFAAEADHFTLGGKASEANSGEMHSVRIPCKTAPRS